MFTAISGTPGSPAGTLLVAHIDLGKICEYDSTGKERWSFPARTPWGV